MNKSIESRKRNIIAHLDEWIDDDGNLRLWLHVCTFSIFHGDPLLVDGTFGTRVHNREAHGLVSQKDLEENEEILVIKRRAKP